MTHEHERLPRTVELAANIVAGHVRRTETAPEDFSALLLTAFRAVRDLERAAEDPALLETMIAALPSASIVKAPMPVPTVAPASEAPQGDGVASSVRADPVVEHETRDQAPIVVPAGPEEDRAQGFVRSGRRTVFTDRLVCLDDGREVTFLGRHLRQIGTNEDDYRRRWSLPADYPMTTQAYVDQKRQAARRTGFGTSVRPDRESRKPAQAAKRRPPRSPKGSRIEGRLSPAFG
jgi:predicted transcriptional regulator